MLIDADEIERVLREQVIKRDLLEGDQAAEATRRVNRSTEKQLKATRTPTASTAPDGVSTTTPTDTTVA
jgi:hypothetical protein